ncbi:helix-hairpin-helix domain-containing protein [Flavobacterium sp. LS1R47]|uniref:Helix-hairpin-helix domain-containing protein n=1 Tax=Flavobacterium frigoritolerans TaxID=2987686 RepID=A0A9X2YYN3_9FLAO|nr:helix-hairpin-helix domain-containing protein [Flavobacterium frigoritolerans]MCV9931069.1 helix-hairpin-helix domain-containing protein [Flavobacterium frigoritolerans]
MDFRKIALYFKFSREQRIGIILLFAIIIVLQLVYFFVDFSSPSQFFPDKEKWMSLQREIDSIKNNNENKEEKKYLFNPNFITDYKGYKLGMTVEQIDRLLVFRKENKYVNSPKEFQEVTKISDSLLDSMIPYFKFPDWIANKKEIKEYRNYPNQKIFIKKEKKILIDLNQATQEDLIKVSGIGEALSLRILKQKEGLGYFVSMEQLKDVWGLSPEVIFNLSNHFKISEPTSLKKIAINDASLKELSSFPYFRYTLAKQIVTYRSMNGNINNIEDLIKIKGFPVEKAKIIGLYLEF